MSVVTAREVTADTDMVDPDDLFVELAFSDELDLTFDAEQATLREAVDR